MKNLFHKIKGWRPSKKTVLKMAAGAAGAGIVGLVAYREIKKKREMPTSIPVHMRPVGAIPPSLDPEVQKQRTEKRHRKEAETKARKAARNARNDFVAKAIKKNKHGILTTRMSKAADKFYRDAYSSTKKVELAKHDLR